MATVFNEIDRVAGDPLTSVVVSITLSWDTDEQAIATSASSDVMIRGTYGTEVDADGRWSVDLVSNDDILPVDSVYKIVERETPTGESYTYYISVPNNATPTFFVGDILTTAPSWV